MQDWKEVFFKHCRITGTANGAGTDTEHTDPQPFLLPAKEKETATETGDGGDILEYVDRQLKHLWNNSKSETDRQRWKVYNQIKHASGDIGTACNAYIVQSKTIYKPVLDLLKTEGNTPETVCELVRDEISQRRPVIIDTVDNTETAREQPPPQNITATAKKPMTPEELEAWWNSPVDDFF